MRVPNIQALQSLTSTGRLAGQIQHPVSQILRAAERLGISAALRLDGVPHFSEADAERIAAELRDAMRSDHPSPQPKT